MRDKLLRISFALSVVINVFLVLWVGNSDIFQHADVLEDLRHTQVKVYKPPIPHKAKPKPRIKPKLPPKAAPKPLPQPKTPPPPQPHVVQQVIHQPQPKPLPQMPPNGHTSTNGTVALPTGGTGPTGTPADVAPQPPKPTPPPPPPPPAPAPPAKPEAVQPPKAAPPQVVPAKPRGVTRSQAVPEGGWGDVTLSADIDVTSLSSTSIVVHFTVDESGSPTNIHIVRSSGNADLDAQVKDLIKHKHYEPAMQDGVALSAEAEHTFSVD